MKIHHQISLKNYNTFGIDVQAKKLVEIHSADEIFQFLNENFFILGGGSNFLLTKDVKETILKIDIQGIKIEKETNDFIWVKANAGENWHHFVEFCIEKNWGGIENLSLIPGNVGTSPVQNIGAYGTEIQDVMEYCEVIDTHEKQIKKLTNAQCQFAYRESIFKQLPKRYIVISVTFKLTKKNHKINTKYGDIQRFLNDKNINTPTIKDISEAVIFIRKQKLPDPKILGNSGSFFKNPILKTTDFQKLTEKHKDIPFHQIDENFVKIPAGFLIESCSLKGYRKGDAGVHTKQALVLVNYANASGTDIYNLSEYIKKCVFEKYSIQLETEVNIY